MAGKILVLFTYLYTYLYLVNNFEQNCQFHQVATSLIKNQAGGNLSFEDLLHLVETTCSKPVDNKF